MKLAAILLGVSAAALAHRLHSKAPDSNALFVMTWNYAPATHWPWMR